MKPEIVLLIDEEIRRAKSLHQIFPADDPCRALRILTEEVGEVAAVCLAHNENELGDLAKELTQVAAVCVNWLDAIYKVAIANRKAKQEAALAKP